MGKKGRLVIGGPVWSTGIALYDSSCQAPWIRYRSDGASAATIAGADVVVAVVVVGICAVAISVSVSVAVVDMIVVVGGLS